jgi:uncharacterized damage-inducible protein DinB
MTQRTRRLLDTLGQHRSMLLDDLARLDAEQLTFRPTPASWSTLDIVEHLVKVEEAILGRLKSRPVRTWREAFRAKASMAVMRVYFLFGRRLKVPAQAVLPQGGATLADLTARWNRTQEEMRRTIEGLGTAELGRPMMRHPLLGLLTPAETLRFLHRHIAHHRRQMRRIRKAPGYPRS